MNRPPRCGATLPSHERCEKVAWHTESADPGNRIHRHGEVAWTTIEVATPVPGSPADVLARLEAVERALRNANLLPEKP